MYRAGPAAPGLPFPRKSLGLYTALGIVPAAVMFLLPIPMFAHREGWLMFREGGTLGMSVILLASIAVAVTLATLGVFAVRGKRTPMIIAGALPAVPLLLGALFYALGIRMMFGAVMSDAIDPMQKLRIVAEGMSEANAALVFGCVMGAAACGAASVALLGATASVDRAHAGAPVSPTWIGSLVVGIIGLLVMLVLRVVFKAHLVFALLVVPSMIFVAVLACIAARHGKLAAGWHDKAEANAWISALLTSAILASAGLVLLDAAATFSSERSALGAISGYSIDPSQRARILEEAIREGRAATIFAVTDGIFAFATVAIGVFGALGKGPDGSTRAPTALSPWMALGAIAIASLALIGVRAHAWGTVEDAAAARKATAPAIELPRVKSIDGFNSGGDGPELIVFADGHREGVTTALSYSSTLVLSADRRAKWADVSKHVRAVLQTRQGYGQTTLIAINVEPAEKPDLSGLGRYAAFVGSDAQTIGVSTSPDDFKYGSRTWQTVRPKPTDDWETVVLSMQPNDMRYGGSSANIVLLPSEGSW